MLIQVILTQCAAQRLAAFCIHPPRMEEWFKSVCILFLCDRRTLVACYFITWLLNYSTSIYIHLGNSSLDSRLACGSA